jgi:hypothetical protein
VYRIWYIGLRHSGLYHRECRERHKANHFGMSTNYMFAQQMPPMAGDYDDDYSDEQYSDPGDDEDDEDEGYSSYEGSLSNDEVCYTLGKLCFSLDADLSIYV